VTDRILRLPEVLSLVQISKPTLYRWIKEGSFPSGIKLSKTGRSIGWKESMINGYIENLGVE